LAKGIAASTRLLGMTDLLLRAEQSYISSQIRKSGVSVGADSREWYRENKTVQSKVYRLA
jgi:hypothetical protein